MSEGDSKRMLSWFRYLGLTREFRSVELRVRVLGRRVCEPCRDVGRCLRVQFNPKPINPNLGYTKP